MKKILKKNILIYGGAFLLFLIILISAKLYLNKLEKENYTDLLGNSQVNITNNEAYINDQFFNSTKIHWTHMPLTYKINFSEYSPELKKAKELRVRYALERIHNAVPEIFFVITESENPDILILGEMPVEVRIENNPQNCPENYVCNIEALADPNFTGNIINNGLVYFSEALRNENDLSPNSDTEVHEILHLFGLTHSDSAGGIMGEWTDSLSSVPIGENIISCLRNIYSNGKVEGNCSGVNVYRDCGKDYIFGWDNQCHEKCGDWYCSEERVCREGKCFGCDIGYTLDEISWSCIYSGCPLGYYLENGSCISLSEYGNPYEYYNPYGYYYPN